MANILITAAHTAEAIRLTKFYSKDKVYLGDYGTAPQIQTKKYRLVSLGKFRKNALAHQLLAQCLDLEIRFLLPVYFEEIEAVSKSALLFEEYGIKALVPPYEILINMKKATDLRNWFIVEQGMIVYQSFEYDELRYFMPPVVGGAYVFNTALNETKQYGVFYYQKES